MMNLESMERIAKLMRYNLVSLFYLLLIIGISAIIILKWETITELTPLLQSMLSFGE